MTGSIHVCSEVRLGAAQLSDNGFSAVIVQRTLPANLAIQFDAFVKAPTDGWPSQDPRDATWDSCALIDFTGVPAEHGDPFAAGRAYGARLPPRNSGKAANVYDGLAQVFSLLPDEGTAPGMRATVAEDAKALLLALREQTAAPQFTVRLELVVGDTCQKWHHDHNVLRSIITYVGPGTFVASEHGVVRDEYHNVQSVEESTAMQLQAGDILMQKGALWPGRRDGAAHRAPPIGPVGSCSQNRLLLKVDILEHDDAPSACAACSHSH
eukprot:TRINITY_DN90665_c0_g1_i1.p1 TRINITY_DN90665_c0_g1~~TRINITY_DN90665_c0_g1_i1.p1  ORF type:complete len:267 (+),score=35.18 TRINITY_DN90665_c0_g1_i1:118-918(+)